MNNFDQAFPDLGCEDTATDVEARLVESQYRIVEQGKLLAVSKLAARNRQKLRTLTLQDEIVEGINLRHLQIDAHWRFDEFLATQCLSQQDRDSLYQLKDQLDYVSRILQGYEGFCFRQLGKVVNEILEYDVQYFIQKPESKQV